LRHAPELGCLGTQYGFDLEEGHRGKEGILRNSLGITAVPMMMYPSGRETAVETVLTGLPNTRRCCAYWGRHHNQHHSGKASNGWCSHCFPLPTQLECSEEMAAIVSLIKASTSFPSISGWVLFGRRKTTCFPSRRKDSSPSAL